MKVEAVEMKIIDSKFLIWFILFVSFVLSQELLWEVIGCNVSGEYETENIYPCFQLGGACVYLILTIYFTKDKQWVQKRLNNTIVDKLIRTTIDTIGSVSIFIKIVVLTIPDLLQPRSLNKNEIKRQIENEISIFKSKPFISKTLYVVITVIAGVIIIARITTPRIVEIITLVIGFVLNIIAFIIICLNIVKPSIK